MESRKVSKITFASIVVGNLLMFTPRPKQDALLEKFGIEVPIVPYPSAPARLVRISAQIYNTLGQYDQLGRAIVQLSASKSAEMSDLNQSLKKMAPQNYRSFV